VSDLPDDLRVDLMVGPLMLLFERDWPQLRAELRLERFERPQMCGPTMAATLARPFVLPSTTGPCHKGGPEYETILIQVAGMLTWGHLAHDPFGSLSKFYGHALNGVDRQLGFASPPLLMKAALPYAADLEDGDLYRVALRGSRETTEFEAGVVAGVHSGYLAMHLWPMFFSNLTLKKALL
jgi:hypothetical protein